MSTLHRLVNYIRPYRIRVFLISICLIVLAVLNLFTIGSLIPLVNLLFPTSERSITLIPPVLEKMNLPYIQELQAYAISNRWEVFLWACGILIVMGFVRFFFMYMQEFLLQWLAEKIMFDIRTQLYQHLHTLSLRFFTSKDTGSQMARVTFDVDVIGKTLTAGIGEMAKEPLILLSYLVLMFTCQWKLALLIFVFFPVTVFPLIRIGQKIRKQAKRLQEERAVLNKLLLETLSGIRIVKAFSTEEYERQRFLSRVKDLFRTTVKIIRYSALSTPLTEFIGVIGVVGTLTIAAWFVYRGELSPGVFTTFMAALLSFYQPLKRLANANNQLQQGLAGAERVFSVLDTKTEIIEKTDAKELHKPSQNIQFEKVSFSYDTGHPVLSNINVTLPINKVIAIVGPSGAGKSTLVNLLPRFYDPSEGRILIDGMELKDVSIKSLRSHMGIVTQDPFLFDDTIFNNIAYGQPDSDPERVYTAARIAHAHDFIQQLPHGYQTMIGERGTKLSGGQKQRLTIARAVLKNPSILIFDEATSSLDAESERLVQDALEKLMENRTTFVIAHRLSTILRADIILVLEKGHLVEVGSHKELLALDGLYKRLYQTQFAEMK